MSLKTRLLAVAGLLLFLASASAWTVYQRIAENIIEQWGLRLAETQVRYDSARLLQALEREMALARQLAESPELKRWAQAQESPPLRAAAIRVLERFRRHFQDRSYFIALREGGGYYHNDAQNRFAGQELRYRLAPHNPNDAWFYRMLQGGQELTLNVNPDVELGVTKVWINVLLRDGERTLGLVGTGMDLADVLNRVVDTRQPGVTTLFVDGQGAIQLHRDPTLIDYATLVKPEAQKSTLDLLLETAEDRQQVRDMMATLKQTPTQPDRVLSTFVTLGGKRYLAGLAYLPSIGWYEATLLDLDELLPLSSFMPVTVVLVLTLLITLLLLHLALRHLVLDPLVDLERAMLRVRDGNFEEQPLPWGQGEVGRLIQHFATLATAIRNHTRQLEHKVRERTEELERLTRSDPLTGLLNRRGMTGRLNEELARTRRQGHRFAVLWLDVDLFKEINDGLGHASGDEALQRIASVLKQNLREYDQASRWGGDEFLVLLSPCDEAAMIQIGERIRTQVENGSAAFGSALSVSLGAHLAVPGESLDRVLQHADDALYAAKAAGRNVLKVYSTSDDSRSQTSQA